MEKPFVPPSPKASTLRSQVEKIIEEAISSGQWKGSLPSESELCRLLKVGRNTVRAALKVLAAKKLILPGGNGRNHTIVARSVSAKKDVRKSKPSRMIRYLSNEPFFQLGELSTKVYSTVEAKLADRGYHLVFEHEPGIYKRFNEERLLQITSRPDTACWILFRTTKQIQAWFQREKIPAVIFGAAHPGISLPAIRLDLEGACRHAALRFLDEGHDHLAFVTPIKRVAAEEESVRGFLSAKAERPDARFSLIEHDFTMTSIMNGILASRLGRKPVTAYLVMEPQEAISVLNILQYSGIRVPESASVVARFGDGTMSRVIPNIAHYLFDGIAIGKGVTKTIISIIEENGPGRMDLLGNIPFQSFKPGGSLARLTDTELSKPHPVIHHRKR